MGDHLDHDDLNFKIDLDKKQVSQFKPESSTANPNSSYNEESKDENFNQQQQPKKSSGGLCACFSIEFYQGWFDVNTADVKQRLKASINPMRNNFFEVLDNRPDLYGPFWIYTTLIFCLAAGGNMSKYLVHMGNPNQPFHTNYDFVPLAAILIYCFGFGVPIIFTALLKFFGSKETKFIDTICIYGYSYSILIPISLLAIIPINIVEWILLILGIASSTWFLLNNFAAYLAGLIGKQRYILLGFIGGAQVVLLLFFKLKFYDSFYEEDS